MLKGYYHGDGNSLMNRPTPYYNPEWTVDKNARITGDFRVVDYSKCRSSVQVTVEEVTTGEKFQLFLSDFFKFFCSGQVKSATLRPTKRGSNLAWVPAELNPPGYENAPDGAAICLGF